MGHMMLLGQLSVFAADTEDQLHTSRMLMLLSMKLFNRFAGK